jgi:hypothetical protein
MVYADNVYLLGGNIDTVKENKKKTLIDASKEVGLEVNAERTKYMLLSRNQIAGQTQQLTTVRIKSSYSAVSSPIVVW